MAFRPTYISGDWPGSRGGGLRCGEMEVSGFVGHGASLALQERAFGWGGNNNGSSMGFCQMETWCGLKLRSKKSQKNIQIINSRILGD